VDALRDQFGPRLEIVSLGPPTAFRMRTWRRRIREFLRGSPTSETANVRSIETFADFPALASSRQMWRQRRRMATRLRSSSELRRAAVVQGLDLWPLLRADFDGIATLQAPWSARAMDEAAAALDTLKPRVIVTYAEAGGWGRALVLEARRRGIRTVGLQHGFISRHWLNYLHEPDEMTAARGQPDDKGFPLPTLTLLYDEFAREHLERRGRFGAAAVQVVGNPRLEAIMSAARALGHEDLERVRRAAGAAPGRHLVLLAIKYRPAWDETLQALARAVANMPDVQLAVRPHPGDAPGCYDRLLAGLSNARVVSRAIDGVALIRVARLVVTINSTVAIEAMPLGVPALAMRLPNYLSPFVEAGAMAGTATAGEIAPTLERLVRDDTARATLIDKASRFAERYRIAPDGRTAARAVEAVRALISETQREEPASKPTIASART
jgi:hypothetical protein